MSCFSCQCRFQWPMDAAGLKRDPINCEKAWLDFAVRLLSREAVGKARGQETVWSPRCKPRWWDDAVSHSWKNPTANPKDTKEVLLEKYAALESHLRAENRFPVELEEESNLWGEGKYKELFLLTSLTSLLGKVSNVHSAVEDACMKVNELNATVNESILSNIQNCLKSSLKKTEQLSLSNNSNSRDVSVKAKVKKRNFVRESKENNECPPTKQSKLEIPQTDCGGPVAPGCEEGTVTSILGLNVQPNDILALAHKLIAKRKTLPSKCKGTSSDKKMSVPKIQKHILPKPAAPVSQGQGQTIAPSRAELAASTNTEQGSLAPVCITVSPEQLEYLLSQNSAAVIEQPIALADGNSLVYDSTLPEATISPSNASQTQYVNECTLSGNNQLQLDQTLSSNSSSIDITTLSAYSVPSENVQTSENSFSPDPYNNLNHTDPAAGVSLESCNVSAVPLAEDSDTTFLGDLEDIEKLCGEILNTSTPSTSSLELVGLSTPCSEANLINAGSSLSLPDSAPHHTPPLNTEEASAHAPSPPADVATADSSRTTCGRANSAGSGSPSLAAGTSGSSDVGYCSEGSPSASVGNNTEEEDEDLFSLFQEDGSFLLHKFLFDSNSASSADNINFQWELSHSS